MMKIWIRLIVEMKSAVKIVLLQRKYDLYMGDVYQSNF